MDRTRADTAASDASRPSQVRAQYDALKRQHPGRILLFQLGDFYETFEHDAEIVARVCDITLTSRELSRGDRVALAGVPVARAAPHIGKLIAAGYHVAICDQVSEQGKGLVQREVTRIITAGTVAEPGLVAPHENNLLVALWQSRSGVGLAAADVTTGELLTTVVDGPDTADRLAAELQRLAPAECLVAEGTSLDVALPGHVTVLAPARFDLAGASDALRRLFGVSALDGFGLPADSPALAALGALVGYVGEANYRLLASLREPRAYVVGSHVALDPSTRRNLELTRTARHGQRRGSLLHAVDRTRTPMGARRLRRLLGQPSLDRTTVEARLDAVAALVADRAGRETLRRLLGQVGDLERLLGRVRQQTASPRDALMLAEALRALPKVRDALTGLAGDTARAGLAGGGVPDGAANGAVRSPYLPDRAEPASPAESTVASASGAERSNPAEAFHSHHASPSDGGVLAGLAAALDGLPALAETIERALVEPGGPRTIRPGHSAELDRLVAGMADARRWLAQLERRERERTGIRSLRVGYNRVFGYYLEVTRPNLGAVPADYQRRQSLVSAERFVTPELKEREALILTAEARIEELERELFLALLRRIAEQARPILAAVDALADLDVLASLADVADERGWTRPRLVDDDALEIVEGRHPVLEALLPLGDVVPNDCRLGGADGGMLIVTGPNMGGKSTYLRMAALITLLAQAGSFVPARSATIGLVDRLFTRVGSEDDLAAGASTFLLEMAETANILRQATPRSLVVLDEVGRGTSTHDGLCLAQAVLEHLRETVGARTLFATHFHELTALEAQLDGVRNVTVAVDERDGGLAFLYRVTPGAADRSYGIQVARLAGLPRPVVARAEALLAERERRPSASNLRDRLPAEHRADAPGPAERRAPAPSPAPAEAQIAEAPADDDFKVDPLEADPREANALEVDPLAVDPGPLPLGPLDRPEGRNGSPPHPGTPPPTQTGAPPVTGPTSDVAAALLAEILALDIGTLTPVRALTLLHDLQAAARAAVPWQRWIADLAGARPADTHGQPDAREAERGDGRSAGPDAQRPADADNQPPAPEEP